MPTEPTTPLALRLAEAAALPDAMHQLEAIARERLAAGETHEQLLLACEDARVHCESEEAEDHILDLMDRLTGWTLPRYRL